ncbi:DUF4347 domain-containing protein [Leptolyngbya sp. FACHB-321]|uniref:DUF4347 domain-containing protein n=1 Tax=Leptolyngbya sp. FACHB-321 TaxID=2692807 RepID=UPI001686CDA4|nr:DUF4347 domain-containing protein [Leptolyngbya sp. FACHB-321]MBD2036349.1 DUF4347 domain-containing protein [Leptolyngbya sp. FACHB-321]
MTFELPRLTTASADVLSTANLAPALATTSLTTVLPALGQSSQSLLFVDGAVADYQQLIAGVSPGTEVYVLNSTQDAVTQITNTLLGRSNVSSLQIVSHGEVGGLNFGSGVLNLTDLPQYAAQIQSWSQALTNDADILLYGCNTAQGELGEAFVSILSQLTGADVAASNDLTGSSAVGGNWNLEVSTGEIESSFALQNTALESYENVLALIVDTTSAWNPRTSVNPFGEDGSATYGQVFTVPFGETTVTSFTFYLNDTTAAPIKFGAYIMAWDGAGARPTGPVLYESPQRATTGQPDFEEFKFTTGGTNVVANSQYVAFLSVTEYLDAAPDFDSGSMGSVAPTTYPGGNLVYSNSRSFGELITTAPWLTTLNVDAAFNLQFGVFSDPPIVTLPGAPLAYTENGPAAPIDPTATVRDDDSPNLNTGTLTANLSNTATADDRLTILNQGSAPGQIGVSGNTVTYGGTTIGTFTGGVGTTPLVVTFNNASTPVAAQALLQRVAYSNVSDAPSTTNRTVSFVVADGANGISTAVNKTITVAAVNDAPTVTAPPSATILKNTASAISGITFADDGAADSTLTATFSVAAGTLAAVTGNGVTVGGTATNLTLAGTLAAINSFITGNNLTYRASLNNTTAQTLSVNITDNGNPGAGAPLSSALTSITLNIADANLLWRNGTTGTAPTGTGENVVWQLKDFTLQNSYYMPTVADLNWQIISTADFDRNGFADIVWRNQVTGENALWQMNSTGYQTGYFLTAVADVNWRIMDTGDFNADGTADLVWRNQVTGQNAIWQMNGFSIQTTAFLTTVADVNWQIVSTADFDRDGATDLLWRNRATGENAIWQMNGLTTKSTFFFTRVEDTNWQVVDTADIDGDGTADIVWRNRATGQNALWQMNSTGLQSGYFVTAVPDVNWQLVGVADLGGDRTPEFLWHNAALGQTDIWQLNGFSPSYLQSYQLPSVPSEWRVRPFAVA